MKLLVGLGNPGIEYSKTRHNIGFMLLEQLSKDFSFQKKFNALCKVENSVMLAMPQTYMNRSGEAVQQVMKFYKISTENLFVVHDDIDLKLGKIKVKKGGGHGGHNGLKSIDQHIGSSYTRIRLGIDRPQYDDISDYVLQNFRQDELPIVNKMIDFVNKNIGELLKDKTSPDDISRFLSLYKGC